MTWIRVPLVPLALALGAGIAVAPWVPPHVAWLLLIAALAWGASLVSLDSLGLATAFLLLGVAAAGTLRASPLAPAPDHVARLTMPTMARVTGRLAAEPVRFAPDRVRLLLEADSVDGQPRSGRIQLTVHGQEIPSLTEGQRTEITARLYEATGFRNPEGFDYAAHLRRDGILVVGTARADRVAALDDPGPPWPVWVRRQAREAMARALPPASAALLGGLLLGDRTGLPSEIDAAFRRAGVYHVLAVSGFNVALVAGAAWALLTLGRAGRRTAAVGAIVAVVSFALVVGPEPSVVRAVIMGVLVLAALLLDREASVMNSLALAALVLLAARPGDLADPGFQLSFAATAGIVLAPLPRHLILGALGVSVAAQLAILPIALTHFNQLSLIGPLANLAAVPLAGVATVVGLLAVALSVATDLGGAIFFSATWPVLLALRAVVALAASVPAALLHAPAPHWAAIVAYTLGLGLALLWWRGREMAPGGSRRAGAAACALLAAAILIALWPLIRPPDGRLHLTVLDVGQGDAIVVEAPDGQAMLIDAGPGGPARLDTGERVVAPFLWNRGILKLAAAVTTHDDLDHAGGMAAVRRWFPVGTDVYPPGEYQIGGVSMLALSARLEAGSADHGVPGPGRLAPSGSGGRRNDDAIVLRLDYGLASFLLTSDITASAERALLAAGVPVQARILKVAHHGSRGSSTAAFLARADPSFAVISVGPRNPYGHPAPATLERLAGTGARIYRTDRDGAVIFETDGRVLTITRWASRSVERYCLDPGHIC